MTACASCKNVHASYGHGTTATRCASCKEPDMRNIRSRMCGICNDHEAIYGTSRPDRCRECMFPGDINVKHPRCIHDGCVTFVRSQGMACQLHRRGSRHTRHEDRLDEYFKSKDLVYVSRNATVRRQCPLRPDFVFQDNKKDTVVIVECDENQHTGYDASEESERELKISACFPGYRVVFIRFNPSGTYTTSSGASKCPRFVARCQQLRSTLQQIFDRPGSFPPQIKLFFNEPASSLCRIPRDTCRTPHTG